MHAYLVGLYLAGCAKYKKIWVGILWSQRTRNKRFPRKEALVTTQASQQLLSSQRPGDKKNIYLLLSLALLDFSSEDLVSEDMAASRFPVRPLCTAERNCFILLCILWNTIDAVCAKTKQNKTKQKTLHVSSWVRARRVMILSIENLISDTEYMLLLASERWLDLEWKPLWDSYPLHSTSNAHTFYPFHI